MARRSVEDQIRDQEERLKQLKAKAAQLASKERAALKARSRQEETRRKIQNGGLVTLAGLAETDRAVLLGGLLDLAERLRGDKADAFTLSARERGAELLAQQAASNQKSAAAQTQP